MLALINVATLIIALQAALGRSSPLLVALPHQLQPRQPPVATEGSFAKQVTVPVAVALSEARFFHRPNALFSLSWAQKQKLAALGGGASMSSEMGMRAKKQQDLRVHRQPYASRVGYTLEHLKSLSRRKRSVLGSLNPWAKTKFRRNIGQSKMMKNLSGLVEELKMYYQWKRHQNKEEQQQQPSRPKALINKMLTLAGQGEGATSVDRFQGLPKDFVGELPEVGTEFFTRM